MDRALSAIRTMGTLDAVVQSTVTMHEVPVHATIPGDPRSRLMADAGALGDLLTAASRSQNGLLKASLVDAAATALERVETLPSEIDRGERVSTLQSHITMLLAADPVGVLEKYSRRVDPDGRGAPTDYFEPMVRSGQISSLGKILTDLSTGNRSATSSAAWAVQTAPDSNLTSETRLVNAHTLGFTVGSIGRAIERTSESARERDRFVRDLVGAASAGARLSTDPRARGASVLAEAAKGISGWFADRVTEGNDALIDDLTRSFTPRCAGPDGEPVRDAVLDAYTDAIRGAMSGPAARSEYDWTPGHPGARPTGTRFRLS